MYNLNRINEIRKINRIKKYFISVLAIVFFVSHSQTLPGARPAPSSVTWNGKTFRLYPYSYQTPLTLPSPVLTQNGTETVTIYLKDNACQIIPVTLVSAPSTQWIWNQEEIDGEDFPTLARTGRHSEEGLRRTKLITGRSVSEITHIGRPGMSSDDGFMAEDEDVISVLLGDNLQVERLGLTHPQLAKPLFHIWNLILKIGHRTLKDDEYIQYRGKKVYLNAHRSKPGQESIFEDGFRGGSHIDIWRELEPAEAAYIKKKYTHLTGVQLVELIKKLSRLSIGEMEPYYIKRYGFYEGHTAWRADPIAIAFIFGIKSIEEIEKTFGKELYKELNGHYIRSTR